MPTALRTLADRSLTTAAMVCACIALCCGASGCKSVASGKKDPVSYFMPSNQRVWSPDQAVLATAEISRDTVLVRNVRNCKYLKADEYVVNYYDRVVPLADITSVDFIMVPFKGMPSMAHTMVSFGMADGDHIAVSVEIRKELGETYSVVKGVLNEFEIMYVVADERDVIDLRAQHRGDDVYVYPLKVTPEQSQALFVDMLKRANKLAATPEFYHTISNNCTTALVEHFNHLSKRPLPLSDPRIFLPGYSDQLVYELGLIDTKDSFEVTKQRANVSALARQNRGAENYSQAIRAGWSNGTVRR